MPKIYKPPFIQKRRAATPVLTGACVLGTELKPTNTQRLGAAGSFDSLLNLLRFTPLAALAASGKAYLFVSNDGGTTKKLIAQVDMAPTADPVTFPYTTDNPLPWAYTDGAGNEEFFVGATVVPTAGIVVDARWGDF